MTSPYLFYRFARYSALVLRLVFLQDADVYVHLEDVLDFIQRGQLVSGKGPDIVGFPSGLVEVTEELLGQLLHVPMISSLCLNVVACQTPEEAQGVFIATSLRVVIQSDQSLVVCQIRQHFCLLANCIPLYLIVQPLLPSRLQEVLLVQLFQEFHEGRPVSDLKWSVQDPVVVLARVKIPILLHGMNP